MSNHFQHFQRLHEWLRVASHQQCSNDIPGESFLAFGALTPNIMGTISWKLTFPFILYSCLRSPLPPPSPTPLAPSTQTSWSPLVGKVSAAILKIMAMIMVNWYLEALKNYKSLIRLIACPKIIFPKRRIVNDKQHNCNCWSQRFCSIAGENQTEEQRLPRPWSPGWLLFCYSMGGLIFGKFSIDWIFSGGPGVHLGFGWDDHPIPFPSHWHLCNKVRITCVLKLLYWYMMTIISDDDSGGDDDDDCNKKRQSLTCPPELTAAAGSDSSAPNPMCFEHSSSVTCYCEHHNPMCFHGQ